MVVVGAIDVDVVEVEVDVVVLVLLDEVVDEVLVDDVVELDGEGEDARSMAPMSDRELEIRGYPVPRWSNASPLNGVHVVGPASTSTEVDAGNLERVDPPLS